LSNQATLYANFDKNYTPVSQTAQGAGSSYTVQDNGETLEIIAQRLWGDSSPASLAAVRRTPALLGVPACRSERPHRQGDVQHRPGADGAERRRHG